MNAQHRTCSKCKRQKILAEFNKNKSEPSGFDWYCRECLKSYRRWVKYRMTPEQYDKMLGSQNNCCKICGAGFDVCKPVIDHCHITNRIRGILCHNCNTAIGQFKDDPALVQSAIDYIRNQVLPEMPTEIAV